MLNQCFVQRCKVFYFYRTCSDIDECQNDVCNNGVCENLPGSYKCNCSKGYKNIHRLTQCDGALVSNLLYNNFVSHNIRMQFLKSDNK